MDRLTRAFFDMRFENTFLTKKGDEFQDFFASIMEMSHPADFQRTRPWGNMGDRKNDGYLKSRRTLFQVYAPNDMEAAKAIAKIDEDYHDALPYWKDFFDHWTFVHNAHNGLGPEVVKKLLELDQQHPSVDVAHWGYQELRAKAFFLDEAELTILLGSVPSQRDLIDLRFDDVQEVLHTVAASEPPVDVDLRPVPASKLLCNGLSDSVRVLLAGGMQKADLVQQYFDMHSDPTLGDRIAAAFADRYKRLQRLRVAPDKIFQELQSFAGGNTSSDPRYQVAVLAVLAFFFEACDIYERPAEDAAV